MRASSPWCTPRLVPKPANRSVSADSATPGDQRTLGKAHPEASHGSTIADGVRGPRCGVPSDPGFAVGGAGLGARLVACGELPIPFSASALPALQARPHSLRAARYMPDERLRTLSWLRRPWTADSEPRTPSTCGAHYARLSTNPRIAATTVPCSSSVSSGKMGSERTSRLAASDWGNWPLRYPRCAKHSWRWSGRG